MVKSRKKTHKEKFLDILRERDIYIKEDEIKQKKKEKPEIEEIEKITPKKKVFKHENSLKKLKEAYNEV